MPRDKRCWFFQRDERPGWWVGWYHNGKLRKKKCSTKSDAKRYARKLEGELNASIYFEPSRKRWDQFIQEYKEHQQPLKQLRTRYEENSVIRRFTEFAYPGLLTAISMHTVEKYLANRHKKGVASATYNKDLRILRLIFGYAVKKRYIKENPTVGLDFSAVDRKIPRILTNREFSRLLDTVKRIEDEQYSLRWRTILSVLWATGIRPSEMLALTVNDVDLASATLKIHAGKTHQERIVSIFFKDAVSILAQYIKRMPTERNRLFMSDTSKLGKEFRPIREKAEMKDVVLYDLRKTLGSWMAANGFTPAQIAAQLGHSSYRTSERYYVNARPSIVEKAGQFKSPVIL